MKDLDLDLVLFYNAKDDGRKGNVTYNDSLNKKSSEKGVKEMRRERENIYILND